MLLGHLLVKLVKDISWVNMVVEF